MAVDNAGRAGSDRRVGPGWFNQLRSGYSAPLTLGVTMKLSARRLVSPAGFLLALVFFLLSFASVSTDAGVFGSLEGSYTGLDLTFNGAPSMSGTGALANQPQADSVDSAENVPASSQILAVITALLLLGGLIATLKPMPAAAARARGPGGVIGLSVVAIALLVITEMVFSSRMRSALAEALQGTANFGVTGSTQTGLGFWLALLTLVLVFGFAVGNVLWDRMQRNAAEQQPPAQP